MNDTSRIGLICKRNREIEKERKILIEQRKNNTMKKEEIYVVIDSEEKRLRAIQILTDAKEEIFSMSGMLQKNDKEFTIDYILGSWTRNANKEKKTEITLDQLEQMLNPNFVVKEIALPFEELQKQAELHGWKLVKEERQIKVGDFGKFWDENEQCCVYGFLESIFMYKRKTGSIYINFAHLTDEEKANIQQNW
jgi:hypothetical protein